MRRSGLSWPWLTGRWEIKKISSSANCVARKCSCWWKFDGPTAIAFVKCAVSYTFMNMRLRIPKVTADLRYSYNRYLLHFPHTKGLVTSFAQNFSPLSVVQTLRNGHGLGCRITRREHGWAKQWKPREKSPKTFHRFFPEKLKFMSNNLHDSCLLTHKCTLLCTREVDMFR